MEDMAKVHDQLTVQKSIDWLEQAACLGRDLWLDRMAATHIVDKLVDAPKEAAATLVTQRAGPLQEVMRALHVGTPIRLEYVVLGQLVYQERHGVFSVEWRHENEWS